MYVREARVRRGDKTYSYFQLVESYRHEGRPRKRMVAHIGPMPTRDRATEMARMLGHLCGAVGCGKAAAETINVEFKGEGRGARRKPGLAKLCDAHAARIKDAEMLMVPLDPERARALIEASRKPPAGGRPKWTPQSREPAL